MKWDLSSNVSLEDILEDIPTLGERRLNNLERDVSCAFGR